MISALPLLALGLAACQTYPQDRHGQGPYGHPQPAPYPAPGFPVGQGHYRAIGTEPFWDLTIGRDLVFTDRGNNFSVAEPAPPVRRGIAGETYVGRRLRVNIVHAQCSDGMSDRTYPDRVDVTVDGRAYRGCGASAAFFTRVGEDGRPREQPLDSSVAIVGRWTAVAIDGNAAAPADRFNLTVTRTMISTNGVCNDLRGSYRTVERRLMPDGPPWPRTERGCDPDRMALEDRVFAVMWYEPVISFPARDRLRLASDRGSIEFERAR